MLNFLTKIGSCIVHLRKGVVRRKVVVALGAGSIPGSIIGVGDQTFTLESGQCDPKLVVYPSNQVNSGRAAGFSLEHPGSVPWLRILCAVLLATRARMLDLIPSNIHDRFQLL